MKTGSLLRIVLCLGILGWLQASRLSRRKITPLRFPQIHLQTSRSATSLPCSPQTARWNSRPAPPAATAWMAGAWRWMSKVRRASSARRSRRPPRRPFLEPELHARGGEPG